MVGPTGRRDPQRSGPAYTVSASSPSRSIANKSSGSKPASCKTPAPLSALVDTTILATPGARSGCASAASDRPARLARQIGGGHRFRQHAEVDEHVQHRLHQGRIEARTVGRPRHLRGDRRVELRRAHQNLRRFGMVRVPPTRRRAASRARSARNVGIRLHQASPANHPVVMKCGAMAPRVTERLHVAERP